MSSASRQLPPVGLGLASVALGAIGLMLFVMPILAIPISGSGLLIGLCGVLAASVGGRGDRRRVEGGRVDGRLALAGAAVCSMALGMDLAISYAPSGYLHFPMAPPRSAPADNRPFIPPPAPSHAGTIQQGAFSIV
jgi:hypothetical protein